MIAAGTGPVELVVGPRLRDLEGLTVNRVWPTARRRLIGPFIFVDHMQPARLPAGRGLDVPPHPHIGLATVTYLFEGEIDHRDSLGCVETIRPGELNWMTAGRGIVHSERSTDAARRIDSVIHGVQAWVALPSARERCAPSFEHYGAGSLPVLDAHGVRLRLIAGAAFGRRSPVATASPLFYAEAALDDGAALAVPEALGERAVYVVSGSVDIDAAGFDAGRLLVLADGTDVTLRARGGAHLMLLGGAPLDGPREIWWNFVSSSAGLIETAKDDWRAGRFAAVPGETGRMPLP